MAQNKIRWLLCMLLCLSCTGKSKQEATLAGNYPKEVGDILLNKCAVSGCHNSLSYGNAAGLNLSTWDDLFKGGGSGSVVVPYRPDFSTLCYFTNTDTALGIVAVPTMPIGSAPLSRAEYAALRDWIAAGARDAEGRVKFEEGISRKKFYVANRLCDVVTVIDAVSMLPMRYIDVGNNRDAKYPYCIKVAPDKQHWYVSFFSPAPFVQQFSAANDLLAGNIELGAGVWTSFAIAADSKHGWFVDNSSQGKVVYVDLIARAVLATYTFGGNFKYPLGIVLNEQLKKLYIGAAHGNFLYKVDITDPLTPSISEMPIDGSGTVQYHSVLDPVDLIYPPGGDKCYVACGASAEVRVVDMRQDALVGKIPLVSSPAFMAYSAQAGALFISCPDDVASFAGNRGAVVVVDAATNQITKRIDSGYQPYGIAVDDELQLVVVANANISSGGPASHHESGCGNKNGNVSFIDLSTLTLIPGKKPELAAFPFAAAVR